MRAGNRSHASAVYYVFRASDLAYNLNRTMISTGFDATLATR